MHASALVHSEEKYVRWALEDARFLVESRFVEQSRHLFELFDLNEAQATQRRRQHSSAMPMHTAPVTATQADSVPSSGALSAASALSGA